VYVNNAEREILPPGFYMTRINSLEPERNYVIQVESIVTVGADVQSTSEKAMIKVRTRPPGPPEPPQSPILEDDPMNSKQVLIRWLPVTLTGQLNGTQIRGYCVYQNGKNMAEVLDPAGDKVSVLRSQIKAGSKITVRTMTIDGELSTDSGPAKPNQMSHTSQHMNQQQRNNDLNALRSSHVMPGYDQLNDPTVGVGQSRNRSSFPGVLESDYDSLTAAPPPHLGGPQLPNGPNSSFADNRFSGYSNNQRHRVRSADFEPENQDWLRHTIDRIGVNRSDWPKSMDRQRARSIPRKIHFNRDSIGFLDTSIDPIPHGLSPATNTLHRHSSRDPSMVFDSRGLQTAHPHAHDHFLPTTNGPNGPVPSSGPASRMPLSYHHRFSKENPNIFDRLRDAQFSDYSESGSLSSLSSWDRRTPTTQRIRRSNKPAKTSSSLSMNDLNFHSGLSQLAIYPGGGGGGVSNRGRSPELQRRQQRNWMKRSGLPRLFVALYDYDPVTQSPNEDAADVELSFREGQVIKVYGEKDDDGFFKGAIKGGKRGLVPCNMIAQVDVPDGATLEALYARGFLNSDPNLNVPKQPENSRKSNGMEKIKKSYLSDDTTYIAVYDYNPSESSPNIDKDEELVLRKGDIVKVLGDLDDDGFYYAKVNGRKGYVPSNYLSKLKHST